jgi:FKBP-type peptidyl-prolyl cis-trans isomerase FkpA
MTQMRLVALLVSLMLVLAACGDDGNDSTEGRGGGNESTVDSEVEGCATDEIVETDSGLKVEDLECGTGEEAEGDSLVQVHYTGELENGTVFDTSRGGEPVTFALGVGQLIEGFEEGIKGMKVGGVRRLTIPPELGYGSEEIPADPGQGFPGIPADSTLVFEIELIDIPETPAG